MLKLAVIGDPIEHSLSPQIHNEVLARLNINCEYTAVHVKKGGLAAWTKHAVDVGLNGFNVTMPHKADIIEYLDEIDPKAKRCGSVNTVVIKNRKLYGYSTDGAGFIMSLQECGVSVTGKNAVIAGKGGAAVVIANALQESGAANATMLGRKDFENLPSLASKADIFVNATPLGMSGFAEDWKDTDFLKSFTKSAVIYDTIYNPLQTTLLTKAKDRGLLTINGLGMLVCQAVLADELYIATSINQNKALQ